MTDFTPAKRGWFAVTERTVRGYSLHTGTRVTRRITVGRVISVARDGTVKRVAPCSDSTCDLTPREWDALFLIDPAKLSDPDGFAAECAERQSTEPSKWRPWEDINDVRQTARRYVGG